MNVLADVPALHGSLVRLEPLSINHGEDLAVAAEEDRAAYGFTGVPRGWEVTGFLAAHFERAKAGKLAPFAQIRLGDGRAVGCTAYWDPRFWPGSCTLCAIEIGRACFATPRGSRSSPPNGRPPRPPCAVAWPGLR